MKDKQHVLILWAWFAGIETALEVRRLDEDAHITILNKDECFSFVPALYETAAGELNEAEVCTIIPRIFSWQQIHYYSDQAVGVYPEENKIVTENKLTIPYDYLVVAIWAETNHYGLPGVAKYALNLKTKDEAQQIFSRVTNALLYEKEYRFVICWWGLTWVEFASTLADHIIEETWAKSLDETWFDVCIINSWDKLLHRLPEEVAIFATNYLINQWIDVICDSRIQKMTPKFIYTNNHKYTKVAYDAAIWCGGLETHPFIHRNGLPHRDHDGGERGTPGWWMLVNEYLQAVGYEKIFGAGDCIDVEMTPQVKTGQNAVHQATICAHNIVAHMHKKTMIPYEQIDNIFYIALGKHMGVRLDKLSFAIGPEYKTEKDTLEQWYVQDKRWSTPEGYAHRYIYS